MKNINKTFMYMVMALILPVNLSLLTSCSREENEMLLTRSEVKITTAVSGIIDSRTDVDYTPTSGSTLNVLFGRLDSKTRTTYTYDGESWYTPRPLYWDDLSPSNDNYTFYAIANELSGNVYIDQRRWEDFIANDLLVACAKVKEKDMVVPFVLKHVLSQLEVQVCTTNDGFGISEDELNSVNITVDGLRIDYELKEGVGDSGPTVAVPGGASVNGMMPYKDKNTFRLITVPQEFNNSSMALNFTFTVDGEKCSYKSEQKKEFLAGKKNVYRFTITKNKVELAENISIDGFGDGGTQNGEAGQ